MPTLKLPGNAAMNRAYSRQPGGVPLDNNQISTRGAVAAGQPGIGQALGQIGNALNRMYEEDQQRNIESDSVDLQNYYMTRAYGQSGAGEINRDPMAGPVGVQEGRQDGGLDVGAVVSALGGETQDPVEKRQSRAYYERMASDAYGVGLEWQDEGNRWVEERLNKRGYSGRLREIAKLQLMGVVQSGVSSLAKYEADQREKAKQLHLQVLSDDLQRTAALSPGAEGFRTLQAKIELRMPSILRDLNGAPEEKKVQWQAMATQAYDQWLLATAKHDPQATLEVLKNSDDKGETYHGLFSAATIQKAQAVAVEEKQKRDTVALTDMAISLLNPEDKGTLPTALNLIRQQAKERGLDLRVANTATEMVRAQYSAMVTGYEDRKAKDQAGKGLALLAEVSAGRMPTIEQVLTSGADVGDQKTVLNIIRAKTDAAAAKAKDDTANTTYLAVLAMIEESPQEMVDKLFGEGIEREGKPNLKFDDVLQAVGPELGEKLYKARLERKGNMGLGKEQRAVVSEIMGVFEQQFKDDENRGMWGVRLRSVLEAGAKGELTGKPMDPEELRKKGMEWLQENERPWSWFGLREQVPQAKYPFLTLTDPEFAAIGPGQVVGLPSAARSQIASDYYKQTGKIATEQDIQRLWRERDEIRQVYRME